jgi:hypothetical protein
MTILSGAAATSAGSGQYGVLTQPATRSNRNPTKDRKERKAASAHMRKVSIWVDDLRFSSDSGSALLYPPTAATRIAPVSLQKPLQQDATNAIEIK